MSKAISIVRPIVEKTIKNNDNKNIWPEDKEIMEKLKSEDSLKPLMKQVMGFLTTSKEEFKQKGIAALNLELPFDEKQLMTSEIEMIKRGLELQTIETEFSEDFTKCQPGKPHIIFS